MPESKNVEYLASSGKKRKLMFRLKEERPFADAAFLALGISHEWSGESSAETEETKDRSVSSSGSYTEKLSLEGLASRPDSPDATDVDRMLHYAIREGKIVEVWDIDFEQQEPGKPGKFYARMGEGLLTTRGETVGIQSAQLKAEMTIDGKTSFGWATVSELNQEIVKQFFYDTVAGAKPEESLELYKPKTSKPEEGGEEGNDPDPETVNPEDVTRMINKNKK